MGVDWLVRSPSMLIAMASRVESGTSVVVVTVLVARWMAMVWVVRWPWVSIAWVMEAMWVPRLLSCWRVVERRVGVWLPSV